MSFLYCNDMESKMLLFDRVEVLLTCFLLLSSKLRHSITKAPARNALIKRHDVARNNTASFVPSPSRLVAGQAMITTGNQPINSSE